MSTYRTGDLILTGTPIVFALYSEERKVKCDFCFKTILSQFECSECNYVRYCSLSCAKNGFEIHEDECQVLKNRPLFNLTRLLHRLIKFNEKEPSKYELVNDEKRKLDDLMDHLSEIKNDYEAMTCFNSVFSELELIDANLDINYALVLYGKILTNSFAIHDEKLSPIGRGIYLNASIFDHSCSPDASFTFIGTTIYIKAMRDLNVDSLREIYISYLNELDHKEDRISTLEAQYYFKCACRRCRTQITVETSRFANETQLRSICELIDKLGLDFSSIVHKYIQQLKAISINKRPIKIIQVIEDDLMENYPEKTKLFSGLIELMRKLRKSNVHLAGPMTAKIFDFLSYIEVDVRLAVQVIDYFRKYYGQTHIRLALKLYLTALLIEEKDCNLRNQLLTESLKIAQIISPTINQIKQTSRGRQTNVNNSFLAEIEKQLYLSKNSLHFDRKMIENKTRFRSASRSRVPLVRLSLHLYK